jgi:hypothetical protein
MKSDPLPEEEETYGHYIIRLAGYKHDELVKLVGTEDPFVLNYIDYLQDLRMKELRVRLKALDSMVGKKARERAALKAEVARLEARVQRLIDRSSPSHEPKSVLDHR